MTLKSPHFIAQHRLSDTAFTRDRKLSFSRLITFLLNFNKSALQTELDGFFAYLNQDEPGQVMSKSALVQARKKLSHEAFIALNEQAVEQFYQSTPIRRWHGYRLCAVDGSTLRLPNTPEVIEQFDVHGGKHSQKKIAMGQVSLYYDVLNSLVIDAQLAPAHTSERSLAWEHFKRSNPDDLLLLDRGYPCFWLFRLLSDSEHPFCMRTRALRDLDFKRFLESGKKEAVVTYSPNKKSIQQCKEKHLSANPVRLRLVRVELADEVEVLVTNLFDKKTFSAKRIAGLYHLRWGVEEAFKRCKQWLDISNFSGKSALSVRQDFHAKILSMNLTAMVAWAAQHKLDEEAVVKKHRYQVNFAQALSKMKFQIIRLILERPGREFVERLIDYLSKTAEAVRLKRSFPRRMSNFNPNIKSMAYKPCR